ncbi:MAG: hypothetical protein QF793_02865, partial [Candidatus Peribacteraceae bacterium]|nr:hypothetical protein [Candidatus Peribacteraceae bacterium]
LLLSYKEAVEVRDMVVELTADMDNETKDALSEAIEAFSSDIEALKYYVDLADREPLLKGDHHEVLKLTADIEEAIALFAQVLEVLL